MDDTLLWLQLLSPSLTLSFLPAGPGGGGRGAGGFFVLLSRVSLPDMRCTLRLLCLKVSHRDTGTIFCHNDILARPALIGQLCFAVVMTAAVRDV